MRKSMHYILPALVVGGLALVVGFFSVRSGDGSSGHQHAAILPAGVANAAIDETTSTIQIERADGKVDEYTVDFKIDGIERGTGVILVSGSANGVFMDAYPIAVGPDDKVIDVSPAIMTDTPPAPADGKPTPTPIAGSTDPSDADNAASGSDGVSDERSIVDPSPEIGPDGPVPPVVP